ncbi:PASTA domain-containing protein [Terriglobus tenax]|uniref:PASTA domain-containing protein n=1 Tax=Terriglobus tenax TaxID=1111115 RepID=UPI0021DF4D3D|nr:PASTA domain-containing protein [Terriglobus tenax]
MIRFFRILLGALAMMTVALLSAFITMRLAIHGREVGVPDFSGLTYEEAAAKARDTGLNMTLDNRYYSAVVPAGRVLQQYPAPGARVRRQWEVRVTQSLGPQRVTIPNAVGMPLREAAVTLRRGGLELGSLAHLPVAGNADSVLAQSPPPNAEGVDKPSVSLLLSESEDAQPKAWVMPNLAGMTLLEAGARISAMGLHVAYAQEATAAIPAVGTTATPQPVRTTGTVIAQSPAAGSRVTAADAVKLTIVH